MRTLLTTPAGRSGRSFVLSLMSLFFLMGDLSGRTRSGGHTRRDPDAVIRRPAHGQTRLRGDGREDAPYPRHVSDRVLRKPTAPALHVPVDRFAERVRPQGFAQVGQRERGQLGVLAPQVRALAMPSD